MVGDRPSRRKRIAVAVTLAVPFAISILVPACVVCAAVAAAAFTVQWVLQSHDQVEVLQVKDGRTISVINDRDLACAELSPDGSRVATVSRSGRITIWDTGSGQLLWRQRARMRDVADASFSPDMRLVALVHANHTGEVPEYDAVTFRDLKERRELQLSGPSAASIPVCFAFAPDGRCIALHCKDGVIRIYDSRSGRVAASLTPASEITGMVFSPDGSRIAAYVCEPTERVVVWKVKNGSVDRTLETKDELVAGLQFSPDGETIIADCLNKTSVVIWRSGDPKPQFLDGMAPVFFTENGDSFLTEGDGGGMLLRSLFLRRVKDGRLLSVVHLPRGGKGENYYSLVVFSRADRIAVVQQTVYANHQARTKLIGVHVPSARTIFSRSSCRILSSTPTGDRIVVGIGG